MNRQLRLLLGLGHDARADNGRRRVGVDGDREIRELLDREAIRDLKARYFRFVDTKQWERWRRLFTDDAQIDSRLAEDGIDAFVARIAANLEHSRSCHHGHSHEIVFMGPDSARGICAMTDHVEWLAAPADARSAPNDRGFVGYGHYEEEYRRVCGEWRISFMRLTRLWVARLQRDAPPMLIDQPAHSPTWLDPEP